MHAHAINVETIRSEDRKTTFLQRNTDFGAPGFILINNAAISHSPLKGLMLVATKRLQVGEVVTNALAVRIEAGERRKLRGLGLYKFVFLDPDDHGTDDRGGYVAFGPISFCNHAGQPNAEVKWARHGDHVSLVMCASQPIQTGSEVTMRYANLEEYPGSENWI